MKVYITKYVLSKGIVEKDAVIYGNMAIYKDCFGSIQKPDWCDNLDESLKKAIEIRDAEIEKHRKVITDLYKIDFLKGLRGNENSQILDG